VGNEPFCRELNPPRMLSIGVTALFGGALFIFSLKNLTTTYGWALFIVLPFSMGFMAAWLHSFQQPIAQSDAHHC
jgi:hypothetical protein